MNKQQPRLCLSAMAEWTGGVLHGADVGVCGATQDSRKVSAGQLFVALPGAHVDGHDYVAKAAEMGAAAALVQRQLDVAIPQLVVENVELALQQAATAWRQALDVRVAAITGSCGKTTVKQMLAAILAEQGKTLATVGNLNNQLGVPLTLLSLTPEHDYAVIEMGASKAGDIDELCAMAAPNVGLITMVAAAHLEGFGSLQGVAEAKGEIYTALPADGVAVLNSDEPYGALWHQLSNAGLVLSFGGNALADVSVSQQHCQAWLGDSAAGSRFQLNLPQASVAVDLPIPGWHNVMNAAAAAAVATALAVSPENIVAGLERAQNVAGRLDIQRLANGAALVDDSYNANPASIKAAAEWLLSINSEGEGNGRQLLVLGEMAELGVESESMHRQLGADLAAAGLEQMKVTGGADARALADGFGQASSYFEDRELLVTSLAAELQADDVVLVKGSRSAAMEQVAQQLTAVLASQSAGQLSESSGA